MRSSDVFSDPILDEIHSIRRQLVQEAGGTTDAFWDWLLHAGRKQSGSCASSSQIPTPEIEIDPSEWMNAAIYDHPNLHEEPLQVTNAQYLSGFRIHLQFSDGTEGDVDLGEELDGEDYAPLKDVQTFRSFYVHPKLHTIAWENGVDFSPQFLYEITTFQPSKLAG